jgi:predicted signal transduction protein with EAL and GGDEF domain
MALSERQKKGIGFIATAVLFAVAGIVLLATVSTPVWLNIAIDAVVVVLGLVGIVITAKPDVA